MPNIVSIIPGGTTQFIDFTFDPARVGKSRLQFCEIYNGGSSLDREQWTLRCFEQSGDQCIDLQTQEFFDLNEISENVLNNIYAVSAEKCLEPFLGQWLPLPIFRLAGAPSDVQKRFRNGPLDWCRIRFSKSNSNADLINATISFDTYVQDGNPYGAEGYPCLTPTDVTEGAEFSLASNYNSILTFVGTSWVREWIEDLVLQFRQRTGQRNPDLQLDALSKYVAVIELLVRNKLVPSIKVVDPKKYTPIDVDLVIDIGNARTIGMLIEKPNGSEFSLNNGNTLELRNLSDGGFIISQDTFSSHVCFSKADFGDRNNCSRLSGRVRPSFSWPSIVRIGQEAIDISSRARIDQGQAFMSSPKRYLWDLRPRPVGEDWRFAALNESDPTNGSPVNSGDFVGYINDYGFPLHKLNGRIDSEILTAIDKGSRFPVLSSRFSRSSMMMFLVSEIVAHALVQVNSPRHRDERGNSETPRRLSRILITVPPAMSVSERKIFIFWVQSALDILWKSMEWGDFESLLNDYRFKPRVSIKLDEASATQIVFVYNEISRKFNGDSKLYFDTFARKRNGQNLLRVASIDIGGGTTDMVVTSYRNETYGTSVIISPNQEFRESFNLAGDDILKSVVKSHVIPKFFELFEIPQYFMTSFSQDALGVPTRERSLRAQVVQKIFAPIGLKILFALQSTPINELEGASVNVTLNDLLVNNGALDRLLEYFGDNISDAKASLFYSQSIQFELQDVATTILSMIRKSLEDLSDVVARLNCDFLVLSGWPSSIPLVQSIFYKRPPIPGSRIIPMSSYHIEHWYPFVTSDGKINDPKTTGVVGAMIAAISEGNLPNLHFRVDALKPASTLRFVGTMKNDQQIDDEDLLFGGMDLTSDLKIEFSDQITLATPINIGFRQFKTERWKTTPLYSLRFSSQAAAQRATQLGLPYRVTLRFEKSEVDIASGSEVEGIIKIDSIQSNDGSDVNSNDLSLQFKTLWEGEGHWLDTGLVDA